MVKEIKFKDLSSGMQTLLGISIILLFAFVIFSFTFHIKMENKLRAGFEDVARWECHNKTISNNSKNCFSDCYDATHLNLDFDCHINKPKECLIKEIELEKAYEDWKICIKMKDCLNIEEEIKEVCEIV